MNNFLSSRDVLKKLGITPTVLHKLRISGKLPYMQISEKTFRYKKEDVDKLIGEDIDNKCIVAYYNSIKEKQIINSYSFNQGEIIDYYIQDWNKLMRLLFEQNTHKIYIIDESRMTKEDLNLLIDVSKRFNILVVDISKECAEFEDEQFLRNLEDLISDSKLKDTYKIRLLVAIKKLKEIC